MLRQGWIWIFVWGLLVITPGYVYSFPNAETFQAEDITELNVYLLVSNISPELVGDLMQPVRTKLNSYGVDLNIVTTAEDAHLVIELNQAGNSIYLSAPKIAPWVTEKSELLTRVYNPLVRFDVDSERWDEQKSLASNLIAAFLLYHVQLCDQAINIFWDFFDKEWPLWVAISPYQLNLIRGNCLLGEGRYRDAIEYLKYAPMLSEGGLPLDGLNNLAWAYLQNKQSPEAIEIVDNWLLDLSSLVNPDPRWLLEKRLYAITLRSQLHALNFDYDAALADMNAAIELNADNPALYVQRGQVYLLLYEWDRVMEDYSFALELDPEYADAYYYRGLLYYTTLVDRQNALPDFERYLDLAPDGEHAEDAQNYADAIRAELKALER